MLQTLKIKNVALIDSAQLNFERGLNVISGETGAGKSIILDSLSFVFGGRADRTLIREKENQMQVEAIFTNLNAELKEFVLNSLGIEVDEELFLFRSLDLSGKNICKLNGELIPLASVKKLCQQLVDLHGQSEHLSILNNDYQLKIVDLFSKTAEAKLEELNALIFKIKQIDEQIKLLGGSNAEKQNLIDLYTYQINEIENAKIQPGEYVALQEEKRTMQQFEKINLALNNSYSLLTKNSFSQSATEQLAEAKKEIQSISSVNSRYSQLFDRLNSALIEVEDIADTISTDIQNNNFDEERFNYVDGRLDFLKSLFRKYGGSEESLNNYYAEAQLKLDNLINGESKRQKLQEEREEVLQKIFSVQEKLTDIRKKSAKTLVENMQNELKTLGMPNARMDIAFSRIQEDFSSTGADRVEFLFSSNLGFELKPLNKVVSGGEMSRVMLAYKIVVASVDNISTILFDEIDSGLSGNIANTVAEYMARLSIKKQIIAISHLPQICAMADSNIKVEKYSDKTTTHTRSTTLTEQEQFEEIARLMGVKLNDTGLIVAKELKSKANSYKESLK